MNTSRRMVTTANAATKIKLRPVDEKPQRRGHRSEIGSDIDDVGDQEQRDQRINKGRRIMAAHVASQAFAGNTANLRADHLDRAHERIGEEEGPTQGVAELGASLRIGGYAAGIVVRRTRDEAGPMISASFGRSGCLIWSG
jgi:hypothetical protein